MNFAKRLANDRIKADLTQLQLGELCNITRTQISKFERGAVLPEPREVRRIAKVLGTDAVHYEKLIVKEFARSRGLKFVTVAVAQDED